jgi:hypothetical protein
MHGMKLILLVCVLIFSQSIAAQDSTALATPQIPLKYFDAISKKSNSLEPKLNRKTEKALLQMRKQEEELRRKLFAIDSSAAHFVFDSTQSTYKKLDRQLQDTLANSQYSSYLDTLKTSIKFLEGNPALLSNEKGVKQHIDNANNQLRKLELQIQKSETVKHFLKERKEYLKQQLSRYGFAKELSKINKNVYYFSQQLNEYKNILKDKKKVEKKALELLSKTKLFKDFMRKNSLLASLFRMPGDFSDPSQLNLSGLQTRAQVNSLIQNQIAAGGPNGRQVFQQNVQQAQSQLNELKNKLIKQGASSSEDIMPDNFKSNSQKTKSFLRRLELGTNVQSVRSNGLLPTTSDLGLSIGYKITDKSIIGIGGSLKIGLGHNFNNIRISGQGASIRSFLDWKIKGSFYLSGGFEMNYRNALNGMTIQTRSGVIETNVWQRSGLAGLSKIISVKSKFFKKTKLQLLWDFLSYRHVPRSQALLFRVGYNLK